MTTKPALKKILEGISDSAQFCKFDFYSPEHFSVTLKCKVDEGKSKEFYNQYVSQWINKFSQLTFTIWIVRLYFPKLKRLVYRKVYVCHRSSRNKLKSDQFKSALDKNCKAKIDFKMKLINRNTIKNDRMLRDGLNMTIFIDFSHTHKIRSAESYKMLRSTGDTDDTVHEYLEKGYTRIEAKNYHELTIIDKYSEQSADYLLNPTINPTMGRIFYLYAKKLKEFKVLPRRDRTDDNIMAVKKAEIIARGGCISDTDNFDVVVVITPVMRRIIMRFELDRVLIDSTCLMNGPVATFIYVPSPIGALPIACLLHTEPTEPKYSQAFFTFKMLLENEINKKFDPKLLLIDYSSEQRKALEAIFTGAKIITSHLSMCNEIWAWLCDEGNKIYYKKRHSIMNMFDSLVRAKTLETAAQCYTALCENPYEETNTILQDYYEKLWNNRIQWLMLDETINCDAMFEISIRLVKELLVSRCKSFTLAVMVDVISNIMDNHQCKILNAYLKGQRVIPIYTIFLPKIDVVLGMEVNHISSNEFRIVRRGMLCETFRTDTWCCDCTHGKKAQFCEHLCGILNSDYVELTNVLPDEARSIYIEIASENIVASDSIKPEVINYHYGVTDAVDYHDEVTDAFDDHDEVTDVVEDHDEVRDEENDHDELTDEVDVSIPSSHKEDINDDYLYLDYKKEQPSNEDPLDVETNEHNNFNDSNSDYAICNDETTSTGLKGNYANALKGLNDEFKRLNGFFKNNVNQSNMDTMMRLAKELSKIRPVERVNFNNMNITLNDDVAKRRKYCND